MRTMADLPGNHEQEHEHKQDGRVSSALALLKLGAAQQKEGGDEAIFAALLMLAKHVPRDVFARERARVLQAMPGGGTLFFRRMMVSSEPMKAAAAALVAAFVTGEEHGDKVAASFADCTQPLMEMLASQELDEHAQRDALMSLYSIVAAGDEQLEGKDAFKRWALGLATRETSESDTRDMLVFLICRMESASWTVQEIATMAEVLKFYHGRYFTTLVGFLLRCFQGLDTPLTLSENEPSTNLIIDLKITVMNVLRSGTQAPREHWRSAFQLAEALCCNFGPCWILLPSVNLKDSQDHVVLLMRLVAVEVTVIFTELRYSLLESDGGDHQALNEERVGDLLIAFLLLEHFLAFFRGEFQGFKEFNREFQWDHLPGRCLLQCRDALEEGFVSITQFVSLVMVRASARNKFLDVLLTACAKCLCSFLEDGLNAAIGIAEAKDRGIPEESGGLDTLLFLSSVSSCARYAVQPLCLLMETDLPPEASGLISTRQTELVNSIITRVSEYYSLVSTKSQAGQETVSLMTQTLDDAILLTQLDLSSWAGSSSDQYDTFLLELVKIDTKISIDTIEPGLIGCFHPGTPGQNDDLLFFQLQYIASLCFVALSCFRARFNLLKTKDATVELRLVQISRRVLNSICAMLASSDLLSSPIVAPLLSTISGS